MDFYTHPFEFLLFIISRPGQKGGVRPFTLQFPMCTHFFITDPDLARICVHTIIAGFIHRSVMCKYCSSNLNVLC